MPSVSITSLIFLTLFASSLSFTPTKDTHLECKKVFEYIYVVECQLPSDLERSDIVRVTSKNITSNLPLKIAAANMPEHFPQGIGRHFPEIEELRVWWAGVKFIDRESFGDLHALTVLDLIGNAIEEIPSDTLYDLPQLEEINLHQNHIKVLNAELLIKNVKLKKFSAGNNEIEVIPRGLFRENHEIIWIDFIKNKIKSFEVDFSGLQKLKTLGLSGNHGECNFNFGTSSRNRQTIEEFQEKINLFCRY